MKLTYNDSFWQRYIDLIHSKMIPYQWKVLNDEAGITIDKERPDERIPSEKSHAIENLRIAAGLSEGSHYGWLFQDSDVYKWLESAANTYAIKKDEKLKEMMNSVADLIEAAQDEDGYISTYYQIEAPQLKFRRLFESHELYCAGHLIEASVAHYQATGDKRLIKVSNKLVSCIKEAFGPENHMINGADGHQEIELALIKLYEVTGDESLLDLSEWFIEIRGQDKDFYQNQLSENKELGIDDRSSMPFDMVYLQAHQPVLDQQEAVGHAVRLVYMAAAMAEAAYYKKNDQLFKAAKRLWNNIVKKRLYITGGIGSTVHGEAFTFDYDLPNDTMYCETCASIGLIFFARAMLKNETNSEYSDVLERSLYNSVISGMALDGQHFFYVNPLEVNPTASRKNPGKGHVKPKRPSWFGCACCPPNLARTLTSLDKYIASEFSNKLMIHLYTSSEGTINIGEQSVGFSMESTMPYGGEVKLSISDVSKPITLSLRIPSWAGESTALVNGKATSINATKGYADIDLSEDSTIEMKFSMPVLEWRAHPLVRADKGKVSIQRGPLVYCLEEEDNGQYLHLNTLTETPRPKKILEDTLEEVIILTAAADKTVMDSSWNQQLYSQEITSNKTEEVELTFIPYHLWANRSEGEMCVWIDRKY